MLALMAVISATSVICSNKAREPPILSDIVIPLYSDGLGACCLATRGNRR